MPGKAHEIDLSPDMQPPPHKFMNVLAPTVSMGGGNGTPDEVSPPDVVPPPVLVLSVSSMAASKIEPPLNWTLQASLKSEPVARREKPRSRCEKRLKEAICGARR